MTTQPEVPASAGDTGAPVTSQLLQTVPPFGASVAGVAALLPDTDLATEREAGPGVDRVILISEVADWVRQLSAAVALRLDGYQRLPARVDGASAEVGEVLSDRAQLLLEARRLVHDGAAHYVQAARVRTGADAGGAAYATTLWQRYTTGLDTLAGWLGTRLAGLDPSVPIAEDGTGSASGLPAFRFPAPAIARGTRF